MSDRALSLNEAAVLLGWSRRTLVRSLARHGIPTIGTGRRARLELRDLETLKAKERAKGVPALTEQTMSDARSKGEAKRMAATLTLPVSAATDARVRSHWKRRLAQINRRSPIERATSPLKLVLYFTDLDETSRELDTLQRALDQATPIANDESLNEEQKRVKLRKTLKAATSAIWASHKSGGTQQERN